jgi:ATP-binding cassette subfamily B multidrug efflux pump
MTHFRKLLTFVKPYWFWSVLSLVLLTLVVFIDLSIPRLIQRIIDQGIAQHNTSVVLQTAALMLGLSVLGAILAIGNNYYSVQAGESVARDMREATFLKIQSFSYGNLDHFTTGNLLVRLSSDASAVQRWVQVSLRIGTRAPLLMIGSLILMFSTNSALAMTMLPLLAVTLGVTVWFSVRMEPLFRQVQKRLDRLNTVLQENIAGARLVKAFVRADYEGQRFKGANEDFANLTVRVMQFMETMSPALSFFVNIGIVVVIWAGGLQAIRGELTLGEIVAFTNYMLTTLVPLTMMARLSNVWANGMASMQRIDEVLDAVPEVREDPDAQLLPEEARGQVVFEHVSFRYNGDQHELVLDDISLVAQPGQMVAILGATGSGKTTLVNLIPRFYDATEGRILIDGLDIRKICQDSLLGHIGIVPQDTVLFSGSVSDNLRYGRPDASDEEIIAAAGAAQAHDFILELPRGYDTHIEERGVNLSGGQKQRLAIARALVTRPKILILDDSTSSVDVETETRIQNAMGKLMQGSTIIVVAQRISTVLNADKILVLERGRVAAEGTHAQLMRSSAVYREIFDSQLGDGFKDEIAVARGSAQA